MIEPMSWGALVAEALRRRNAEGLTQREHAALAGVSVPTMIAFDRGAVTLTLSKAFDILRVVGLLHAAAGAGLQESFVRNADGRWRELTADLPSDSPARFPHGWCRIDYCLEGDRKAVPLQTFLRLLKRAAVRHTGWPPFWVPTRPEIAPREHEGLIECWVAPSEAGVDRALSDPAHCGFWCGSPQGRMFLIRGHQEDGQETFPPGVIFDLTLPIWRLGEAMLHAARLASLLAADADDVAVRFRALYTGLAGRELRAWANPMAADRLDRQRARSDEAALEITVEAGQIEKSLETHVLALASPLYDRFGVAGISRDFVAAELARMRVKRPAR